MKRTLVAGAFVLAIGSAAALADAHVSVSSGPGFANASQVVWFGVGHGCEGADTYRVEIEIPAGVTSVRPQSSEFGKVSVERDASQVITGVVFQKADADTLDSDIAYYQLGVRMKLPDAPFTTLYFPTRQTCRTADGGILTTDWVATTTTGPDGGALEPAPTVKVLPARKSGWNKYTVPAAMSDLSVYFGDALIVWKDSAAYSSNTATGAQIAGTAGVSALTSLAANDVVWVKY